MYYSVSNFMRSKPNWRDYRDKNRIVLASAPCDPIHSSHIDYLWAASQLGDTLITLVNSDKYLLKKKGYCLLPSTERAEILQRVNISQTVIIHDEFDISSAIRQIKPHIMAQGGDRVEETANKEELIACRDVGCMTIYGVGGYTKTRSSSEYFRLAVEDYNNFISERERNG